MQQRLKPVDNNAIQKPGRLRQVLALGLGVAIGGGVGGLSASAAPTNPAVLAATPAIERHVGKVAFVELVTPDLAAARLFYAGLFGWAFQDIPSDTGPFTQVLLDGRIIAGIRQRPAPPGRRPAWLTFIASTDVDKATANAAQQGAKVFVQPHDIASVGRAALLADPQGAVFAILTTTAGDPPDLLAEPGEWIWSSLVTTDPATDAAFYKALFGYDVFTLPNSDDAGHLILGSENFARASVNPIPTSWGTAHPRWLNYIRVIDATTMAAKVTALGGHVLLPPRLDRHGGRIVVVADPQGALFGLLEWPADAPAGDAK